MIHVLVSHKTCLLWIAYSPPSTLLYLGSVFFIHDTHAQQHNGPFDSLSHFV